MSEDTNNATPEAEAPVVEEAAAQEAAAPEPAAEQDFGVLPVEDMWGALTDRLRGYVYVQTNKGIVRIDLQQTVQSDVDEAVTELLTVPTPPKKKQADPANPKKKIEVLDTEDREYIKSVDDYGLMITLLAVDQGMLRKPSGDDPVKRCERYKLLSTASLATIISGIQDLNQQRFTSDMHQDRENGLLIEV